MHDWTRVFNVDRCRCARTQSACHSCCFWGREEKRRLVVFVTEQAERTGEAQE